MFDFSFGEMGLIAVVALLVLGPERLPRVARTAGALVRRARNSWQNVRDEIERELQAEDLKRSFEEARRTAADLRDDIHGTAADLRASAEKTAEQIGKTTDAAAGADSRNSPLAQEAVGHEPR
ncbi:MAG: Sec-independent protein translocase protein TatB [Rudaea sp.]|uniref:Sec-independent protein translocase protein TatB n=1 Tax=Rudaea sp. TaxID=2136325 RepID=UPI0039E37253